MQRLQALQTLFALSSAIALCACSDDDDDVVPPAPTGDLLLSDGPSDQLSYLRANAIAFELERENGAFTTDLLAGPTPVDLLALDQVAAWIGRADLATGTYVGARVTFESGSFEAGALDGSPVPLTIAEHVLEVDFVEPVVLNSGDYRRFDVDFDVDASLVGDVESGFTLAATGVGLNVDPGENVELDDFAGIVGSFDALGQELVVGAYADGDFSVPIGNVLVRLIDQTFLVDDDGEEYAASALFFAELVPGQTRIEVEGTLTTGEVIASKLEIEDQGPAPGPEEVELRGFVVGLTPGVAFELQWTEVVQGQAVFSAALGLDPPPTLLVSIEPDTQFELESQQMVDSSSLAVGQEVEVEFDLFSSSPFPAAEIEIDNQFPAVKGVISDVLNLPASFELSLDPGQPALTSGAVADPSTPLTVQLSGAAISLDDVFGTPLDPDDLTAELRLEARGTITGTPAAPTLAAVEVEIEPGELEDAQVTMLDEPSSTFEVSGGLVLEPLGGGLPTGPLVVEIEPGCLFEGAASDEQTFFALGAGIEVDIEGIADAFQPNRLRAWYVEVEFD